MPRAHRIVWIGDVDELGLFPACDLIQRLQIFAVVSVRHCVQAPAVAFDVIVERGIGSQRGDDGISGIYKQTYKQAKQVVNSTPQRNFTPVHSMFLSQRLAQRIPFWVTVPVYAVGGFAHRSTRARRCPKIALVGADAETQRAPHATL